MSRAAKTRCINVTGSAVSAGSSRTGRHAMGTVGKARGRLVEDTVVVVRAGGVVVVVYGYVRV